MDNKIVQTLARALVALGYTSVRFNFRGIGASRTLDHGVGEVEDALAVIRAHRAPGQALVLGGFPSAATSPRRPRPGCPPASTPNAWCWSARRCRHSRCCRAEGHARHPRRSRRRRATHRRLRLGAPAALPVTVVPGAGHFFHGQLTLLKHIVNGPGIRAPLPEIR